MKTKGDIRMNINKKFAYTKLMLILTVLLLIAETTMVSFAWFSRAAKMSNMKMQILQIESLINSYMAYDINNNGVPDLLTAKGENDGTYYFVDEEDSAKTKYYAYVNPYYTEKYDFQLIDTKYAITSEAEYNLLKSITLTEAVPSKVYTIKYEITNYNPVESELELLFMTVGDYSTSLDLAKLQVRAFIVENSYGEQSFTAPDYGDWEIGSVFFQTSVPKAETTFGRTDLWVQIKIRDDVTEIPEVFTLPLLKLQLSAEYVEE